MINSVLWYLVNAKLLLFQQLVPFLITMHYVEHIANS